MKWLKLLTIAGVAGALLLTASVGSATTLWLSTSASPSVAANETFNATPGQNFTIYVWAQMTAGQVFTGLSHDLKVSTAGVVSRTGTPAASYTIENPVVSGARWSATGTGSATAGGISTPLMLIDNSAMSNISGANMGSASPTTSDPTYNSTVSSYLVSSLTVVAGLTPSTSTSIFIGVGTGTITFKNSVGGTNLATSTAINFGFGDTAIAGNDSRRTQSGGGNAISTLADMTVNVVPEPSTFVLVGLGLVGLVGLARRRRSA